MALTDPEIEALVEQYLRELARFEKTAAYVADQISRRARSEAVRHLAAFRAKQPDGVRGKLQRKRADPRYVLADLQRDLGAILTDLAGCRLVVYDPDDEARLRAIVVEALPVVQGENQVLRKDTGYRATHVLVRVPESADASIRGTICEVQVCPLASHLFNELEHDIIYKTPHGDPSEPERAQLGEIRHAVELANGAATRLSQAHARRVSEATRVVHDAEELRHVLEQKAGRPLRGDFERLHRLLGATIQTLTPAAIEELGVVTDTVAAGRAKAVAAGLGDVDDVVAYAVGLTTFLADFGDIVRSWRGPNPPLKTAILGVEQN